MESIQELKRQHPGEWLAIEVTRYENSEPVEGKLAARSKDWEGLWESVKLERGKRIHITFAGPLIEEGYAVAFDAI